MKFTKMQGAGNDFILVETPEAELDWSRLAVAMCDRHYGIGADGLLVLLPSDAANFKMRIFNADGSASDVCGNGLVLNPEKCTSCAVVFMRSKTPLYRPLTMVYPSRVPPFFVPTSHAPSVHV